MSEREHRLESSHGFTSDLSAVVIPASPPNLLKWLREQIDEDERVARWAEKDRAEDGSDWWWDSPDPHSGAEHLISRYHPARVLREVEANRLLLELHKECTAQCYIVRVLALPYVDRPGYREEWRP